MKNLLLSSLFLFQMSAVFADDPAALFPLTEIKIADGRDIVADVSGKVVYTFDPDAPGVSTCYDGCAKTWPPVIVTNTDGIQKPMGVTTRKTGELQLTMNGKPLYYFKGDKNRGDIKGDGLGNVWHIIED